MPGVDRAQIPVRCCTLGNLRRPVGDTDTAPSSAHTRSIVLHARRSAHVERRTKVSGQPLAWHRAAPEVFVPAFAAWPAAATSTGSAERPSLQLMVVMMDTARTSLLSHYFSGVRG